MRHIHLDPLGGAAGDMFVAAMLDAFPEHRQAVNTAASSLSGVGCRLIPHQDDILSGSRFVVDDADEHRHHSHDHRSHDHHSHDHHAHEQHGHVHWREIRDRIQESDLQAETRDQAVGIFACLAEAEARVHGVAPDDVTFHEVGAADSIADIVAAAAIIALVGPASWSVSPLPLGSGQVRTAHGLMPVPAPATALLLEGFATHDDGIGGERVTPTGAAILRHLGCTASRPPGTLRRSGFGFGTRRLPEVSNCLRALVFDTAEQVRSGSHRELAVVSFEVDDQSGEDLAAGIDRIRAMNGVHDVVQIAAFGKKNRLAVHVQVLAVPASLDEVVAACFQETTTIGLRTHLVQGRALPRRFADVDVDGQSVRVKLVERPGGTTGKAEADHVLGLETHAARSRLRRDAEREAETA